MLLVTLIVSANVGLRSVLAVAGGFATDLVVVVVHLLERFLPLGALHLTKELLVLIVTDEVLRNQDELSRVESSRVESISSRRKEGRMRVEGTEGQPASSRRNDLSKAFS